ncbi:MAG: c-type cytochrome [Gammaproteobacteria bacterium]
MSANFFRLLRLLSVVPIIGLIASCSDNGEAVRGFVLPKGDVAAGQATFVEIGCPKCHTVAGTDIKQPDGEQFHIQLGGEQTRVKHYGDLLTSVVNPDHKVAKPYQVINEAGKDASSPMPKFVTTMTVEQLVDVVEFLHSSYTSTQPDYLGTYYYYGP